MNKGFTLIELISIIVIVSLISLLVGKSITSITKQAKSDLSNAQELSIKHAAEAWMADNMDEIPETCTYVTLSTLKEKGFLNDIDKSVYSKNVRVKICKVDNINSEYPTLIYEVEVSNE